MKYIAHLACKHNNDVYIVIPSEEFEQELIENPEKYLPEGCTEFRISSYADDCYRHNNYFRDALAFVGEGMVDYDLNKMKGIAHNMRRYLRETEFNPFDEIVAKRIPTKIDAEQERAAIREKYDLLQIDIDKCKDVDAVARLFE